MFLPLPIRFDDGREFHHVPVVNALLIVSNVLAFWLGWHPSVGPGTGLFSVVTYAFGHANVYHLAGNMFALLVFGSAVNRRLGNAWYSLVYFATAASLGIVARLFCGSPLIGASGAIFAVIAIGCLLMPSALVRVFYFALFPATCVIGLLDPPRTWVFWFIRWDTIDLRAWWGLLLIPLLEFGGLLFGGWNWPNLGHLLGLLCGLIAVVLLPTRITMPGRVSFT